MDRLYLECKNDVYVGELSEWFLNFLKNRKKIKFYVLWKMINFIVKKSFDENSIMF